jgi:hypothetical protein
LECTSFGTLRIYHGDIAAECERDEETARQFLQHALRRVSEWTNFTVQLAHQQASIWRLSDEEDRLP